jgi:threonine/homoserine/homoserine lactone efflux protein
MSAFVEGLIAGYGIAIPVGAIAILIVNTSLQCGFRVGFAAGAGAATVDLLYATLAVVAGAAIVTILEPIAFELRLVSGLVLIALAVYGLWRGLKRTNSKESTLGGCNALKTYTQFVAITFVNPLTVVYFTALVLGRGSYAGMTLADQIVFVIGAGLASLSWQTLLAVLGGLGRERLSPRFQNIAVLLGNLIILVLGVLILLGD